MRIKDRTVEIRKENQIGMRTNQKGTSRTLPCFLTGKLRFNGARKVLEMAARQREGTGHDWPNASRRSGCILCGEHCTPTSGGWGQGQEKKCSK